MVRPSHKFLAVTVLALDDNREGRIGHLPNLLETLQFADSGLSTTSKALDSKLASRSSRRALLDGCSSWLTWLFRASCCSLYLRLNSA